MLLTNHFKERVWVGVGEGCLKSDPKNVYPSSKHITESYSIRAVTIKRQNVLKNMFLNVFSSQMSHGICLALYGVLVFMSWGYI